MKDLVEPLSTFRVPSDLSVVNAARVSFSKWHDELNPIGDTRLIEYLARNNHWTPFAHPQFAFIYVSKKPLEISGPGIIHFYDRAKCVGMVRASLYALAERNLLDIANAYKHCPVSAGALTNLHTFKEMFGITTIQDISDRLYNQVSISHQLSFAFGFTFDELDAMSKWFGMASFRIKMPIFVAREWFRHTHDIIRNEESRRYITNTPDFYAPSEWREVVSDKKQGSGRPLDVWGQEYADDFYITTCQRAVATYEKLLRAGVCPEQARMVLPQSMYTTFIETGSIETYKRIIRLRTSPNAQAEIREYANAILIHLKKDWPTIVQEPEELEE